MKNSLIYFLKTQLTIIFTFNFILLIAYIPLIIFSMIVFGMMNVQRGMDAYSYVACAVPVIVFFCCGVYYKNTKYYSLSSVLPKFVFFAAGKDFKGKTEIVKPGNIILRYLPVVFPLIYTLVTGLFYEKVKFHQIVLLVNVPYNWIFLTPAWYMIFSGSTLNSLFFPIILPMISYFMFIIGYAFGDKSIFIRFFKEKKKA